MDAKFISNQVMTRKQLREASQEKECRVLSSISWDSLSWIPIKIVRWHWKWWGTKKSHYQPHDSWPTPRIREESALLIKPKILDWENYQRSCIFSFVSKSCANSLKKSRKMPYKFPVLWSLTKYCIWDVGNGFWRTWGMLVSPSTFYTLHHPGK